MWVVLCAKRGERPPRKVTVIGIVWAWSRLWIPVVEVAVVCDGVMGVDAVCGDAVVAMMVTLVLLSVSVSFFVTLLMGS